MEFGVSEIVCNPLPVGSGLTNLSARDVQGWEVIGNGSKSSAGVRVTPTSAMGYPPLWRALNLVSDKIACLPFDCFERDGDDRKFAADHPANRLMRGDASEWTHGETVRKTLTAHAMLYGNGFAVIDRDSRRNPIELTILDPQKTGIRIVNGELWYFTWIDDEQAKIPARDVLHIKGLSHNGLFGHDVISLMKDALGVGMAAQQFGGRFFGQGSNVGGLLMIPGHFDEQKIRNTMSAWEKMTQGLQQAHKVALLQDGAKFQQLTLAPNQAQFLETRQFEIRSTVANIFGIPPHKLGDDSRTSHNSLESENQAFLDDCINPWLKEWERECRRKLLSDRERKNDTHFFEFNREALVSMEYEKKVNGLYRLKEMGVMNDNEIRRVLNMPDLGEEGEIRFHPANWVRADMSAQAAQMGAQTVQNEAQNADKTPPDQPQNAILRAILETSVTKNLQIEKDRVVRAAKTRNNFCDAIDSIYETWQTSFVDTLGWKSVKTITAISTHVEQSKQQLLEVAGSSTTSNLEKNVRDLVSCWDERGELLVNNLLKAAQ